MSEQAKVSGADARFCYDDGGRADAGFKGEAGDCVTRAIAIATGLTYREAYATVNNFSSLERRRNRGPSSARTGVSKNVTRSVLAVLGWSWTPTMHIGQGCKVHLRADELPKGRIIVQLSRHVAAVIDGVLHDTSDCSRGGMRCVYGYFSLQSSSDSGVGR